MIFGRHDVDDGLAALEPRPISGANFNRGREKREGVGRSSVGLRIDNLGVRRDEKRAGE
jgi:hypothetical protein